MNRRDFVLAASGLAVLPAINLRAQSFGDANVSYTIEPGDGETRTSPVDPLFGPTDWYRDWGIFDFQGWGEDASGRPIGKLIALKGGRLGQLTIDGIPIPLVHRSYAVGRYTKIWDPKADAFRALINIIDEVEDHPEGWKVGMVELIKSHDCGLLSC